MSPLLLLVTVLLFLLLSAVFSGSETGFYSVSRLRVDADAAAGQRSARVIRGLLGDETALLVTILIGNNLSLEILTHLAEGPFVHWEALPSWAREVAVAGVVTPTVFFFGELLPKDLFRRRPYALVSVTAPLIWVARAVFLPLSIPLRGFAHLLDRAVGVDDAALRTALGREAVVELLREGTRHGALTEHAQLLAENALELRSIHVSSVLVPWGAVAVVRAEDEPDAQRDAIAEALHTRLPVVGSEGEVLGYVHQLEVLGDPEARPAAEHLRPILELEPELSVDRALARLRLGGHRVALVGTAAEPVGLLSLKDLVERISGELAEW